MKMPSLVWTLIVTFALLGLWRMTISFYRWWKKPIRQPERLLKNLQRSLRLTRADKKHCSVLTNQSRDPIFVCQFLLDPSRWPIDKSEEAIRQLYEKIFHHSKDSTKSTT